MIINLIYYYCLHFSLQFTALKTAAATTPIIIIITFIFYYLKSNNL
jgi:hypothetical protein